jgi:predicted transcriptional regulator
MSTIEKICVSHDLKPLALIPKSPIISKRTVREVLEILDDGVCLYGAEHLDMSIDKMWIHTMQMKDLLNHLHNGQLAIM